MSKITWSNVPVTNTTSKYRSKKNKDVVNQIFADACKYCMDNYWQTLLTKASVGKLPTGFYFRDNTLSYKKGTKIVKIELSSNPEDACSQFIEFLETNGGLSSNTDTTNRVSLFDYSVPVTPICSWSEIKSSRLKRVYLLNFLKVLQNKYNLTNKQSLYLSDLIQCALLLGEIDNSCFKFYDGELVEITGLIYDPETQCFRLENTASRSNRSNKSSRKPKSHPPSYLSIWNTISLNQHNVDSNLFTNTDVTE